jgi:Mg2+ and Co2+ transporter CorA
MLTVRSEIGRSDPTDAVVDHYFPLIESLGDSMEEFQQTVLDLPAQRRQNNVCTGTKTQVPCTSHKDLRYSIRARF